jgi:hypothetical protein
MFRFLIAIVSLTFTMGSIDFNAFFADYSVDVNLKYDNGSNTLILDSADTFSSDGLKINFNLRVLAMGGVDMFFKYNFPIQVRIIL